MAIQFKQLVKVVSFSAATLLAASTSTSIAANEANLLPDGFKVVNFSGGWRRGGSDPNKECLSNLQRNYPGGRFQILSKGEDGRWTGWHGRDREYRYWCTALVQNR